MRGSDAVVHDGLNRGVEGEFVHRGAIRQVQGHPRGGERLGEIIRALKSRVHALGAADGFAVVPHELGGDVLQELQLGFRLRLGEEVVAFDGGGGGGGGGGGLLLPGDNLGLPVYPRVVLLLVDVGGHRAVPFGGALQTLGLEPAVVVNLGEVLDAVVGEDGYDDGAVVNLAGEDASGVEVKARGSAEEKAVVGGHLAAHGERVLVVAAHHAVDDVDVEATRDGVLSDTLHLPTLGNAHVVGGDPLDDVVPKDGTLGVRHDHADVRVLALEVAPGAADRAAGASAGDKVRHVTRGLSPNFRTQRSLVRLRVVRVVVLIHAVVRPGVLGAQAIFDVLVVVRVVGSDARGRDDDLAAVRPHGIHLLLRRLLVGDDDVIVPAKGARHRDRRAGVAARGGDDLHPGL